MDISSVKAFLKVHVRVMGHGLIRKPKQTRQSLW